MDASTRIGVGHLMRCLTLAECLRKRGAETQFICRSQEGNLIGLLRERKIPVAVLPSTGRASDPGGVDDYAAWMGVSQDVDARQSAEALKDAKPDWLVVDHYGLDAVWERLVRPHASAVMVISDLEGRNHDCDVLLNQNYSNRGRDRYKGQTPEACRLLLGPRYALLRPEFARHRGSTEDRDGKVRRVFVFFGGTDQGNVTGRALNALLDDEFADLEVDVVVGANNPHREELREIAGARRCTRLHGPMMQMADLMVSSDLAIGAGGGTAWERLCLGLPSIVVSIAENQEPACEALAESGLIHYLGADSDVGASDIRDGIRKCMGAPAEQAAVSARGRAMVDGLGAGRIAEILDPTPASGLHLRPAEDSDSRLYFSWVNDPEVRRQSLNSQPIDWPSHRAWFSARIAASESRLFVLEAGELPVGQIRFDRDGAETAIDYSIDPAFRGRGWARHMLSLGLERMRLESATVFRAEVKQSNPASIAIFTDSGFVESRSTDDNPIRIFRRNA